MTTQPKRLIDAQALEEAFSRFSWGDYDPFSIIGAAPSVEPDADEIATLTRMNERLTEECEQKHRLIEGLKADHANEEELHDNWLNQFDALMGEEWDGDEAMESIVLKWAQHAVAELATLRAKIVKAKVHIEDAKGRAESLGSSISQNDWARGKTWASGYIGLALDRALAILDRDQKEKEEK